MIIKQNKCKQLIGNKGLSTVQRRKWSPTTNDPQTGNDPRIGPQMIPDLDRKWSRRKTGNSMDFGFLEFFIFTFYFVSLFIYFHQLKENWIKLKKRYTDNVNYNFNRILLTNPSHFFSLDNSSEKLREKSKLINRNTIFQQARSTTIIA